MKDVITTGRVTQKERIEVVPDPNLEQVKGKSTPVEIQAPEESIGHGLTLHKEQSEGGPSTLLSTQNEQVNEATVHRRGRTGALKVLDDEGIKRQLGVAGRKLHKALAEQAMSFRAALQRFGGVD